MGACMRRVDHAGRSGFALAAGVFALLAIALAVGLLVTTTRSVGDNIAAQQRTDAAVQGAASVYAQALDLNALANIAIIAIHALEGTTVVIGGVAAILQALTVVGLPQGIGTLRASLDTAKELYRLNRKIAEIRDTYNAYAVPGLALSMYAGPILQNGDLPIPYPFAIERAPAGNSSPAPVGTAPDLCDDFLADANTAGSNNIAAPPTLSLRLEKPDVVKFMLQFGAELIRSLATMGQNGDVRRAGSVREEVREYGRAKRLTDAWHTFLAEEVDQAAEAAAAAMAAAGPRTLVRQAERVASDWRRRLSQSDLFARYRRAVANVADATPPDALFASIERRIVAGARQWAAGLAPLLDAGVEANHEDFAEDARAYGRAAVHATIPRVDRAVKAALRGLNADGVAQTRAEMVQVKAELMERQCAFARNAAQFGVPSPTRLPLDFLDRQIFAGAALGAGGTLRAAFSEAQAIPVKTQPGEVILDFQHEVALRRFDVFERERRRFPAAVTTMLRAWLKH